MIPPTSGILVLNKPPGISSRQCLDRVGRVLPRLKMGHAGTLDPMATGVLVVCFGKATRLIQYVQRMQKEYQLTMRLGVTSATHDLESELQAWLPALHIDSPDEPTPLRDPSQQIDWQALEQCLLRYSGTIMQVPPQYSALHIAGRRAYELARAGHTVPLQPRSVQIDRLVCERFQYPDADLELQCSSGTYVRSLVRDIGNDLGCGAVMVRLIRTRVGAFQLKDALDADTELHLRSVLQAIRPLADALQQLPTVRIDSARIEDIRHGRAIDAVACDRVLPSTECTIVDHAGTVLAVAQFDDAGRSLKPRTVLIDHAR